MSVADRIVSAARACLGTPFHHQGRQPGQGLDCAGLVIVAAREAGLSPADVPDYGRRPNRGQLEDTLDAQDFLWRVGLFALRPGDVLLMRFARDPQHLAIYTGSTIIHSYETVGAVVEHGLDERWQERIVRAYRFREVSA